MELSRTRSTTCDQCWETIHVGTASISRQDYFNVLDRWRVALLWHKKSPQVLCMLHSLSRVYSVVGHRRTTVRYHCCCRSCVHSRQIRWLRGPFGIHSANSWKWRSIFRRILCLSRWTLSGRQKVNSYSIQAVWKHSGLYHLPVLCGNIPGMNEHQAETSNLFRLRKYCINNTHSIGIWTDNVQYR